MIPLLHLAPIHAEPLKYIVSELVRNYWNTLILLAGHSLPPNTIRKAILSV